MNQKSEPREPLIKSLYAIWQPISRRRFVKAGAGAAAAGAVAAGALGTASLLGGCSSDPSDDENGSATDAQSTAVETPVDDGKVQALSVPQSAVIQSADFVEADLASYVKLDHSFTLPIGSQLIWQSTDTALAMIPGNLAEGGALVTLASVRLANGKLTQLLKAAIGAKEGYVIYAAAASIEALAWVECNLASNYWRFYVCSLNANKLGEPRLADEGDALWDPPQPAVSGSKVYWQRMPDANGSASTESSQLKSVAAFERDTLAAAQTIITSTGRFATAPQIADGTLCVAPRAEATGIYYQLTALDVSTDDVIASVVLPQSMRISNAVYTGGHFAFSTTSNYDYADGLALFGTYLELDADAWLHINRAPSLSLVRLGTGGKSLVVFKSSKSVVGLDIAKKTYVVFDILPDSADYGDIMLGAGQHQRLTTYTTVFDQDAALGSQGKVVVRIWRTKK